MRDFKFNKVIPRPKIFDHIISGSINIGKSNCSNWVDVGKGKNRISIPVDTSIVLEAYGYKDWYEWNNANWGTKWDIDEKELTMHHMDNIIWVSFDSAWSPPRFVIERLAELYPKTVITHYFEESGMDFAGTDFYEYGVLVNQEIGDYPQQDNGEEVE